MIIYIIELFFIISCDIYNYYGISRKITGHILLLIGLKQQNQHDMFWWFLSRGIYFQLNLKFHLIYIFITRYLNFLAIFPRPDTKKRVHISLCNQKWQYPDWIGREEKRCYIYGLSFLWVWLPDGSCIITVYLKHGDIGTTQCCRFISPQVCVREW